MTANYKVKFVAKLLLICYYFGQIGCSFTFKYNSAINSAEHSKIITFLLAFPRFLITPLILFFCWRDVTLQDSFGDLTFFFQISSVAVVSIFVSIRQLKNSENYTNLLNKTLQIIREMKILNIEVFTEISFLLFVIVKCFINLSLAIFYIHSLFRQDDFFGLVLNTILLFMVLGIENFFSFTFLGFLITASILESFGKHLKSIHSLKDLNNFLKILTNFRNLFEEFIRITEFDIFLILVYYFQSIAASLMWFTYSPEFWFDAIYSINALIFLLMFNFVADKIIRLSKFQDYGSPKFLTNDSMVVSKK